MYLGAISHGSASCHVPCPWTQLPCSTPTGPGCHVPRISFREDRSRQGKGVSSAKLTAVFNLLLMSYDMPSAQLPCFHPQPQAYLRWCRLTARKPSVAGLLAVRGVGCIYAPTPWVGAFPCWLGLFCCSLTLDNIYTVVQNYAINKVIVV